MMDGKIKLWAGVGAYLLVTTPATQAAPHGAALQAPEPAAMAAPHGAPLLVAHSVRHGGAAGQGQRMPGDRCLQGEGMAGGRPATFGRRIRIELQSRMGFGHTGLFSNGARGRELTS